MDTIVEIFELDAMLLKDHSKDYPAVGIWNSALQDYVQSHTKNGYELVSATPLSYPASLSPLILFHWRG